jgi:hypothetical protein
MCGSVDRESAKQAQSLEFKLRDHQKKTFTKGGACLISDFPKTT